MLLDGCCYFQLKLKNMKTNTLEVWGSSQFEVNQAGYRRKTNPGLHLRLLFEELLAEVTNIDFFWRFRELRESTFHPVPCFPVAQRKTEVDVFLLFSMPRYISLVKLCSWVTWLQLRPGTCNSGCSLFVLKASHNHVAKWWGLSSGQGFGFV